MRRPNRQKDFIQLVVILFAFLLLVALFNIIARRTVGSGCYVTSESIDEVQSWGC